MNHATATADGYTASQTYAYSPTSSSSPTVNTGTNETSGFCSALNAAGLTDAGTACKFDTTYAVAYNSTNHTVSVPARTPNLEPPVAAWDIGVYNFQSGIPAVNPPVITPPSGAYASPQTVSISCQAGARCCYTNDGSTPTATAGTCTNGNVYTVPFSQSIPATVQAIGTESGYNNSSVVTNVYTLSTTKKTGLNMIMR